MKNGLAPKKVRNLVKTRERLGNIIERVSQRNNRREKGKWMEVRICGGTSSMEDLAMCVWFQRFSQEDRLVWSTSTSQQQKQRIERESLRRKQLMVYCLFRINNVSLFWFWQRERERERERVENKFWHTCPLEIMLMLRSGVGKKFRCQTGSGPHAWQQKRGPRGFASSCVD